MSTAYPVVDEFGRGSCTCNGKATGCAVCSCAAILVRFGKKIPRLADGTPDMITLGRRMGARCRAFDGCQHGRSLDGLCGSGRYWCGICIKLELEANGVPAGYARLSWPAIERLMRARQPVCLSGMYDRFPIVKPSSYAGGKVAKGRSDASFGGQHMVVGWDVEDVDGLGRAMSFNVSDPDFGSPSRPTVPSHSVISAGVLKAYWAALSWPVCYALRSVPQLNAPTPTPAPAPVLEEIMLGFRFVSDASGVATIKADRPHSIIRLRDGKAIAVPAGQQRRVYAKVALLHPFDKKPGDRTNGFLIGEIPGAPNIEAAFVLATDVTLP